MTVIMTLVFIIIFLILSQPCHLSDDYNEEFDYSSSIVPNGKKYKVTIKIIFNNWKKNVVFFLKYLV